MPHRKKEPAPYTETRRGSGFFFALKQWYHSVPEDIANGARGSVVPARNLDAGAAARRIDNLAVADVNADMVYGSARIRVKDQIARSHLTLRNFLAHLCLRARVVGKGDAVALHDLHRKARAVATVL